jgi:copper chaperone CopZ
MIKQQITFKISGMHCVSCSLNIDGELEDTDGVVSASTSYAKSETKVEFDPHKVSLDDLKKVIQAQGYGLV